MKILEDLSAIFFCQELWGYFPLNERSLELNMTQLKSTCDLVACLIQYTAGQYETQIVSDPGKQAFFIGEDLQGSVESHEDELFRSGHLPKERNPSDQDVFEHDPVTYKGIKRVLKGRGSVFFEKEVPCPSGAVAGQQQKPQDLGVG